MKSPTSIRRTFCAFALLLALLPMSAMTATIASYTPVFRPVTDTEGRVQIQLRTFEADGKPMALVVNPLTLVTTLAAAANSTAVSAANVSDTPYLRALATTTASPVRLQNHGLRHAIVPTTGQFLSVDLCPSKRLFEQSFFEAVVNSGQKRPVPVAVAITGAWLATHGTEFSWLREQERAGNLAISWVNHSLTHPYDSAVPLAQTFLLTPGLDRRREILDLEKELLEKGVVPAPFFRFPGLVADAGAMTLLRELGLIPLGSDAWLAKGEQPRAGSIILVHGNGNEPAGISAFTRLQQRGMLLPFLPLAQAVVATADLPATK